MYLFILLLSFLLTTVDYFANVDYRSIVYYLQYTILQRNVRYLTYFFQIVQKGVFMTEKKMDRRVRKTKDCLAKALIELLQTKNIHDVSVRELADKADINRGTFYLHYKDPYDMMSQMERETLQTLREILMAHHAREINDNPLVILEVLYDYVSEHTAWISLLLGENGTLSFINSLNDVVRSCCIDHWMEIFTKKEAKTYDYFCSFIVSGCVALVNDWLNSGMKESAEEMAILSRDIIRDGIRVLSA